ncbi:hypothetical protein GGR00_002083 [Aminobacter aganoensis]|uniref:GNAT family N-acetyltransferase n=1 Tax=Aminobacter aganoensis TaxID=83264 RepID=A0A7X0F728_9HYPH|nr:hypothetical protein [Aminobacter aganoensis]
MAAEFTIRRARREDLPELVQLYRHLTRESRCGREAEALL